MTRKDYLDGKVSCHEYHLTLANAARIGNFNVAFLAKVKACLDNGDEYLNTIPLAIWDNMCMFDKHNTLLFEELKKRGDCLSLSTGVCMRKAKAKEEALAANITTSK